MPSSKKKQPQKKKIATSTKATKKVKASKPLKVNRLMSKPLKFSTISKHKKAQKKQDTITPQAPQAERVVIEKQRVDIPKPAEIENAITQASKSTSSTSQEIPKFDDHATHLFQKPDWVNDQKKVDAEFEKLSEKIEKIESPPVVEEQKKDNTKIFSLPNHHEYHAKKIMYIAIGVVALVILGIIILAMIRIDPYIEEGVCSASIVTVQEGIEIRVPVEMPSTQCHKIIDCEHGLKALKFNEDSIAKMRLQCEKVE